MKLNTAIRMQSEDDNNIPFENFICCHDTWSEKLRRQGSI